jgi:flagellar biogenesis protein FliO
VIFDKPHNQMGFISSAKAIQVFPNSNWIYYALDLIAVLGLLAAVLILMLRRQSQGQGQKGQKVGELA